MNNRTSVRISSFTDLRAIYCTAQSYAESKSELLSSLKLVGSRDSESSLDNVGTWQGVVLGV